MNFRSSSNQLFQESNYGVGFDYFQGSPHLKHRELFAWVTDEILNALKISESQGLLRHMLDIGAGDGSFDVAPLADGWNVTSVEESRPSITAMMNRFASNPRFEALFDSDGDLSILESRTFSVILLASVLHHIPDYQQVMADVLNRHLEPGGVLLTFQDPMWYPEQSRFTHLLGKASYFSWRITQGSLKQGFGTQLRRAWCTLDELNPLDMVDYHVVRQGVNQTALVQMLEPRFESVELLLYWSTQSAAWQRAGKCLGLVNTFAIRAHGFRG